MKLTEKQTIKKLTSPPYLCNPGVGLGTKIARKDPKQIGGQFEMFTIKLDFFRIKAPPVICLLVLLIVLTLFLLIIKYLLSL